MKQLEPDGEKEREPEKVAMVVTQGLDGKKNHGGAVPMDMAVARVQVLYPDGTEKQGPHGLQEILALPPEDPKRGGPRHEVREAEDLLMMQQQSGGVQEQEPLGAVGAGPPLIKERMEPSSAGTPTLAERAPRPAGEGRVLMAQPTTMTA